MDDYREEVKTVLDALVLEMPGVVGGKAFGYPAYKVNRKMFAFVGGDGIAIKLSLERVGELVKSDDAAFKPFQPVEGTVWKQWLSIDRADPDEYRQDVALLEEAVQFVLAQT